MSQWESVNINFVRVNTVYILCLRSYAQPDTTHGQTISPVLLSASHTITHDTGPKIEYVCCVLEPFLSSVYFIIYIIHTIMLE